MGRPGGVLAIGSYPLNNSFFVKPKCAGRRMILEGFKGFLFFKTLPLKAVF
jgi:hypothetical protein